MTGKGCVTRVYTELAAFHLGSGAVRVTETFGIGFDDLATRLDVPLTRP